MRQPAKTLDGDSPSHLGSWKFFGVRLPIAPNGVQVPVSMRADDRIGPEYAKAFEVTGLMGREAGLEFRRVEKCFSRPAPLFEGQHRRDRGLSDNGTPPPMMMTNEESPLAAADSRADG
jgi:hypothetical protein